jgi:hypothetical protein
VPEAVGLDSFLQDVQQDGVGDMLEASFDVAFNGSSPQKSSRILSIAQHFS